MADRRFGGFWRRFFAFLVDKVILYFVSLFLFLIGLLALDLGGVSLSLITVATGDLPCGMGLFIVIYFFTTILTGMIYFTWFHGTAGQTPGKMLLRVRVIQVSGEEMTIGVAFLRCVGYLISALFFWLGFIWIAFDQRKQGWHDKIAATLVIRMRNEPYSEIRPPTQPACTLQPLTDGKEPLSPSHPSSCHAGEKPGTALTPNDVPASLSIDLNPEAVPSNNSPHEVEVATDTDGQVPHSTEKIVGSEEKYPHVGERDNSRPCE
jgi:uncharacterized RDD family membrane protein YckC